MGHERLHAGPYHFTTIADDTDGQFLEFEFNGTPVVSNNGTVVFGATLASGVSGLFAGTGGPLTTLVDSNTQHDGFQRFTFDFQDISINSTGTVAFLGTAVGSVSAISRRGVFTVDASGTVTTIAAYTSQELDYLYGVQGVSINDAGAVAFFASLEESSGGVFTEKQGIYVGQGGPLTPIVEYDPDDPSDDFRISGNYKQPNINNKGDVAFLGRNLEGAGIYVGNGASLTRIVGPEAGFTNFIPEARFPINDAGTVAYLFRNGTSSDSVRGVYTYSDGTITKIVDYNDLDRNTLRRHFSDFTDVMINNKGTVAFGGLWDPVMGFPDTPAAFSKGIYTGPDPEADKVIALGDLLDGSPVTDVIYWSQGLNDRDQIAFYAETESGSGIYLATPVPEPAGSVLMLAAALAILCRRPSASRPR